MDQSQLISRVKSQWNELFAKEAAQKNIWQRVSIGLFVLNVILVAGLINVSTQAKIVPWIVEVDSIGRALAVAPAKTVGLTDDRIIKAHLVNFVEISRSIIGDPEAMRRNFSRVYELVTPEVRIFLNEYYQKNNPMDLARTQSREIVVLSFLKESKKTYIVEWREITRDLSNKVIEEIRYKGLFIISQPANLDKKSITENPGNPFGIVITSISWSKVM